MKTKIYKISGIVLALVLVFSLGGLFAPAPESQAIDTEPVNSLRLYGEGDIDAAFPYTDFDGPFNLASYNQATKKDFVVWNPAYMWHMDLASNGLYGTYFQKIVVNGNDANEKVHLRQWYVPKYPEPRGCVWVAMTPIPTPDIVKEYTWILLDTYNNPVVGLPAPSLTSFVFPIADNDPEQCGLDSYDAITTDNTLANVTVLNTFRNDFPTTGFKTIDLSTGVLTVVPGDIIQFLDHAARVVSLSPDSMMLEILYGGNQPDAAIDQRSVVDGDVVTSGRHAVHSQSKVMESPLPQVEFLFNNSATWKWLRPITEPWYLDVIDITSTAAFVRAGRLIQEQETFFVDGCEYDVAMLYGVVAVVDYYKDNDLTVDVELTTSLYPETDTTHDQLGLKYITIRNPLPKVPVNLEPLTITKCQVFPDEPLPLLPPFNMEHDVIDDINIPEIVSEVDPSCGNPVPHADEQWPDNVLPTPEKDLYDTPDDPTTALLPQTTGTPDGYGDQTGIKLAYNTIAERRVMDVEAAVEFFIKEEKEPRFDQNLLEEKFTESASEVWNWINIETLPWDFTEFVLPEQTDKPTEEGFTTGDYILVSSWKAPNSFHTDHMWVRVKFCYDAEVGIVHSADIYVNDYANYNSLRLYGEGGVENDAAFPYTDYKGPFDLTSAEAPDKDFVVWNPAYMWHMDLASNGLYGTYFQKIVVNGNDANEKVHLRQWYVPKYPEPRGCVWVAMTPIPTPDIVKEYTWILLDTYNNPVVGLPAPSLTSFVFPIADNDPEQCGLDSYDAITTDNTLANVTVLNTFRNDFPTTGFKTIDLSTGVLTVVPGDIIQFLDHAARVVSLSPDSMMLEILYGGNQPDAAIDQRSVVDGDVVTSGRHAVHSQSKVMESPLPQVEFLFNNSATWKWLRPITEPWYLDVIDITSTAAFVRAGRLIQEQETFFVDGCEYDVAMLYGVVAVVDYYKDNDLTVDVELTTSLYPETDTTHDQLGLKYITIRNPLPKVPVNLEPLTITKCQVFPDEPLPLLPPFNMEHDVIDDINIPEIVSEVDPSCGNPVPHADEQWPDNVLPTPEKDLYDTPDDPTTALLPQTTGTPDGYGDQTGIKLAYNTIAERRVMDVEAAVEFFIKEEKEPRFDQNLLEEKFTELNTSPETWEWINIETLPWDFTELVLPEQTDKPTEAGFTTGDYILVSSFWAPNSNHDTYIPVRVKFCYDAENGTGIYVNSTEMITEPLVADAGGPYSGVVDEPISISGSATGGTPPYTYDWDLDNDGLYDDFTGQSLLAQWSTTGLKTIGLQVTDSAMLTDTDTAEVDVTGEWDPWVYDEDESGVIEINEVLEAISDYFAGSIDITEVLDVITLYFD